MNNKFTTPLIKNLTQRKNREYRKLKEDAEEKSVKKIENQETLFNHIPYLNPADFNNEEGHFDHFAEFDHEILKHHTKTNPSTRKK